MKCGAKAAASGALFSPGDEEASKPTLVLVAVGKRHPVPLEPDYARKLASLAERTHVQEGTLARSLLFSALDEADPDASPLSEL